MRLVRFRKGIRDKDEYHTPYYITVTLQTDEPGGLPHDALDYLEAAIQSIPERMGEPAIVEHLYGLCEGCDGRADGYNCPAKTYLDVEVLK